MSIHPSTISFMNGLYRWTDGNIYGVQGAKGNWIDGSLITMRVGERGGGGREGGWARDARWRV